MWSVSNRVKWVAVLVNYRCVSIKLVYIFNGRWLWSKAQWLNYLQLIENTEIYANKKHNNNKNTKRGAFKDWQELRQSSKVASKSGAPPPTVPAYGDGGGNGSKAAASALSVLVVVVFVVLCCAVLCAPVPGGCLRHHTHTYLVCLCVCVSNG